MYTPNREAVFIMTLAFDLALKSPFTEKICR